MLEGMFGSVLESVPEGTKTIDARDWELWCSVMGELGVAPWRGDIAAHRGLDSGGYWRDTSHSIGASRISNLASAD